MSDVLLPTPDSGLSAPDEKPSPLRAVGRLARRLVGRAARQASAPAWASLSTPELLRLRVKDLGLRIAGSEVEAPVERVLGELAARGLSLEPRIYLGDEWFSPEGVPAVSVPFVFAHPRLLKLEHEMLGQVEGADPDYFLRLLRHEIGHCFDHAYRVSRTVRWKRIFGPPARAYDPDHFRPRPYSRAFVRNLEGHYGQSHPDEDFAETFAVWLDPARDWEREYAAWPAALKKLRYVDELARTVGLAQPKMRDSSEMCAAHRMRATLATHYERRRRALGQDLPGFFDADLRALFRAPVGAASGADLGPDFGRASDFFLSHEDAIVDAVSAWSRESKYTVRRLILRLSRRSAELGLRLRRPEEAVAMEAAAYLSAVATRYRLTGRIDRAHDGQEGSEDSHRH
ncbi:MAG: putative zinc-binding metallopeptidase [Bdellovibrionales bacterium]|nr:putative zinc-binding metallopeptidase [Bdellovibrionales bacterium]